MQARLSVSTVGNIVGIQAQEIAKAAEKYATMSTYEAEVCFRYRRLYFFFCAMYNKYKLIF